jgi:hypothetical protein
MHLLVDKCIYPQPRLFYTEARPLAFDLSLRFWYIEEILFHTKPEVFNAEAIKRMYRLELVAEPIYSSIFEETR